MVKFSKEYEAQLVPEWRDAFLDYWKLKDELKKIQMFNNNSFDKQNDGFFKCSFFLSFGNISSFGHKQSNDGAIHVLPLFLLRFFTIFLMFCFFILQFLKKIKRKIIIGFYG